MKHRPSLDAHQNPTRLKVVTWRNHRPSFQSLQVHIFGNEVFWHTSRPKSKLDYCAINYHYYKYIYWIPYQWYHSTTFESLSISSTSPRRPDVIFILAATYLHRLSFDIRLSLPWKYINISFLHWFHFVSKISHWKQSRIYHYVNFQYIFWNSYLRIRVHLQNAHGYVSINVIIEIEFDIE